MKNYEYIIAGLPVIDSGFKFTDRTPDDFIAEIREQLDGRDNALVDFLLDGYCGEKLDTVFYHRATTHPNRFLREFFLFDLNLRNAKVKFLNNALERPADKDVLVLLDGNGDAIELPFEEEDAVADALRKDDLLSREKALDDLVWEKISDITVFDTFDMDAVLAFIAKMQVAARWFKLDEQTGREMFRKLSDEVRGTFKGVDYNA
ncbi:MAG: DUF2764 family protein [Candidatus Cryptobacteroides sp.]